MQEQIIQTDDDDIRLDRWFKRHHPGFPHAMLEKHLRKGLIRLDGKKAKSSDRLQQGQKIAYPDIKIEARAAVRQPMSAEAIAEIRNWVLYEDERIIVVNKPAGLAVQGGTNIDSNLDDMLDGLAQHGARPKLTHRLDRDTSGVLVLARNAKVATALMHLFSARKMNKTYLALVNNVPEVLRGTITLALRKRDNPLQEADEPGGPEGRDYEIMSVSDDGQPAITEYRVREALARKFALMELHPLTGRTHQLRVHMQAIGSPIVGDHKYGGSMNDARSLGVENRLHLHAWQIEIPAFASGKGVKVSAPLPKHMKKSFAALGIDIPKA